MPEKVNKKTLVLGLMSGTSLDGLDLALCEFNEQNGTFSYQILDAETITYSPDWKRELCSLKDASAETYFQTDARYATFVSEQIMAFLTKNKQTPHFIASHGHTLFHQPAAGFSTQLGSGAVIAAKTGITTVCDFRSLDVANAGQGAPLVPIGDKKLFSEYAACLNIGGIANISLDEKNGARIAYDISEANMLLNFLAERRNLSFDKDGALARSGEINEALLLQLNALPYYSQQGVKSLGREWFGKNIQPFFEKSALSIEDLLSTATEHVAEIIANDLTTHQLKNVLVTGGGAFNGFLIEKIKSKTSCQLIIPDALTVNFKEALIFAFLGYLRMNNKVNTLASVTGAKSDSVGGAVYLGKL